MPVLLAHAIGDSTDIFGISGGGGFEHPKPPLGTPLIVTDVVKELTSELIFHRKYKEKTKE